MRLLTTLLAGLVGFVVVFVLALHLHFPGEVARDRIAWELQEASKGGWMIDAADAHLYRLSGLALEDVTLLQAKRPVGRISGDADPAAVPVLRAEEAAARVQLLPLLSGARAVSYHAALYGGALDGQVRLTEGSQRLVIDGEDIDLSRIPFEGEDWAVDAAGLARIDGDVTLATDDVKNSTGHLELELTDLVLQSATVMGMTLEPTPFSEAVLSFDIDGGKAEVDKGSFQSDPVQATVDGEIVLNKAIQKSRLKLTLEVHFGDQFDKIAQMVPNLKAARDDDGAYHFRVTGTLQRPRFREERQTKRSTRTPTRPPTKSARANDGGAADEDAEARRQERRDRIRDRRKKMLERRNSRNKDDRDPGAPPTEFEPDIPLPGQPPLQDVQRFDEEEIYDPEEGDLPPDEFVDDLDEGDNDMDLALPAEQIPDDEY